MTVANERYVLMDENAKKVEAQKARTLKKEMVFTMVQGKVLYVHTKFNLKGNIFEMEAGQKVFYMKQKLIMFGKLDGDPHCRMVFIRQTSHHHDIYTFTECNLDLPKARSIHKLKLILIDDVIVAISTNKNSPHAHGVKHASNINDALSGRVRGQYEKFFLDLHEIPIEYRSLDVNKISEKVKFTDILKWKSTDVPSKGELVHKFIQWMFPNIDPSEVAPEIEPITKNEAKAIREDKVIIDNFIRGYEWFLNFLGIGLNKETGILHTNDDWPQRKAELDVRNNHNFRRITRVLYALRELGLCKYMGHLYAFLVIQYEHFGRECKEYWRECFTSDTNGEHNHIIFYSVMDFLERMKEYHTLPEHLPTPQQMYTLWLTDFEEMTTPTPEGTLRFESGGSAVPAPKFKVGDLCWFTPQGGVKTEVKIIRVDDRMSPFSYRVENTTTNVQHDVDFEDELVMPESLLQRAQNIIFQPNNIIRGLGYTSTNWDTVSMSSSIPDDTSILRGFYNKEQFDEHWKDIKNVIHNSGNITSEQLRFFASMWCNMYGGLNVHSTEAEINEHLTRRDQGRETYLVLQGGQLFRLDGTFNNIDCMWNGSHAIRDINPTKIDNILITINANANHWILARVNLKSRQIEIYDSFNTPNVNSFNALQCLIRAFYLRKLEDDRVEWAIDAGAAGINDATIIEWHSNTVVTNNWQTVNRHVPQQTDGHACGVYVCMVMAYILSGKNPQISTDISFENIPKFRRLMARLMCEINCGSRT